MTKKCCLVILSALFFIPLFAAQTHSADAPLLTGIPVDEELAELLKQVIPYIPPEKDALPEEKRFLFNLNKLLNEDLSEQSNAYKLAAAKIALRTALAMNKMVDSIEVRRSASPTEYGMWRPREEVWLTWDLGGVIEDEDKWEHLNGEVTIVLFALKGGKIVKVNLRGIVGSCGGKL